MSNFQSAANVNALVGNEFNGGWAAIESQMKIIAAEWKELLDGVNGRDIHELRDGVQDMLFTVYGLGHRAGLPVDQDFAQVVESQFSKFDPDEASAALTREKYAKKGMEIYQLEKDFGDRTMIVTYSAIDQLDDQGRKASKGKWLKSHRFQEPTYEPLPDDVQFSLEF